MKVFFFGSVVIDCLALSCDSKYPLWCVCRCNQQHSCICPVATIPACTNGTTFQIYVVYPSEQTLLLAQSPHSADTHFSGLILFWIFDSEVQFLQFAFWRRFVDVLLTVLKVGFKSATFQFNSQNHTAKKSQDIFFSLNISIYFGQNSGFHFRYFKFSKPA